MTQIFRHPRHLLRLWRCRRADEAGRQWRRDPLSHPDIARMSKRELADLPFDPTRIAPH
ncbi:hypothetical protein [Rhodophyticola porphyridii]|uniref:hypothetical protein n=1 Tax=Rhodophyticola porphyridii TaxID=1852017 RepID=UPI001B114ED8|nr:hypothetical protein [Roseicyclus sp.]MBO6921155.1 hypothetical protein [Roseicyclus sp.]